mmetsp:Transcript_23297/g.22892  ORF Transcript_23297/g.22892 Transcript_23297/m.22892 type:complete len:180 (+) Transcript_23297:4289-4828(+)
MKDHLEMEDQLAKQQQAQSPLKTIEECALSGQWVFISTVKFPSFWNQMCRLLEKLRKENKMSNNFRVFVDMQGLLQNEIPDSFLFEFGIRFYMTEKNNEDMEGFNDIWANILNDKILNDITEQQFLEEYEEKIKKQRRRENGDYISQSSKTDSLKIRPKVEELRESSKQPIDKYMREGS